MDKWAVTSLILALTVLSGCSGLVAQESLMSSEIKHTIAETATPTESPTDTRTSTPTRSPTKSPSPTMTPYPSLSPTPELNSPFGHKRVFVGIGAAGSNNKTLWNYSQTAVDYWNSKGQNYTTYPVEFILVPKAENPDMMIYFADEHRCGNKSTTDSNMIGCAPILNTTEPVSSKPFVLMQTGYKKEVMELALKHEFGHIVGLEHNMEPKHIMRPTIELKKDPDDA